MAEYKDAVCYIPDIEIMIDKSYSTCKRVMARVRKHYGLQGRERPTIQQVKEYLVKVKE